MILKVCYQNDYKEFESKVDKKMLENEKDLNDYKIDMLDRGQTQSRIDSVDKMLKGLSNSLVPTKTVSGLQKSDNINKRKNNKNQRL